MHQFGVLAFGEALRYQAGMSEQSIEDLARKLADSVPDSLRAIREDLEDGFRSVLRNGLDKLDLVTREEFDAVRAMAQKAREENEALAARLAALEAKQK